MEECLACCNSSISITITTIVLFIGPMEKKEIKKKIIEVRFPLNDLEG